MASIQGHDPKLERIVKYVEIWTRIKQVLMRNSFTIVPNLIPLQESLSRLLKVLTLNQTYKPRNRKEKSFGSSKVIAIEDRVVEMLKTFKKF